jgi:flagellar biosynthesis component FlhA
LSFQETANLLESWRKEAGAASRVNLILADQASQLHFARLLHDLVRENVPITAHDELLRSVEAIDLRDENSREAALCAARLGLKTRLPGNGPAATRLALPGWAESKMTSCTWRDDGKPYLALSRSDAREILRQIRSTLRASSGDLALVTQSALPRPFVQCLASTEFPSLAVLSHEAGHHHLS